MKTHTLTFCFYLLFGLKGHLKLKTHMLTFCFSLPFGLKGHLKLKTHTLTFCFSLPFGLKGHAIRGENLRNLYIWFKSPKWEFWFPRSWKKRGFFWGQEFAILLKKEVPATWSRNFLDTFQKNPHISRKKFMKWQASWQ